MRVRHGEANAIPSLREEICDYGNRFGPTASCCFADLRSHLRTLARASSSERGIVEDVPEDDISHVLEWAKGRNICSFWDRHKLGSSSRIRLRDMEDPLDPSGH
mmetsp:Transcript_37038/g.89299  ORF Transcript_37038/g.89299 Transcript_37038/m.89299 type:complete len:104 (-) Transcript_37038:208-519(-)